MTLDVPDEHGAEHFVTPPADASAMYRLPAPSTARPRPIMPTSSGVATPDVQVAGHSLMLESPLSAMKTLPLPSTATPCGVITPPVTSAAAALDDVQVAAHFATSVSSLM